MLNKPVKATSDELSDAYHWVPVITITSICTASDCIIHCQSRSAAAQDTQAPTRRAGIPALLTVTEQAAKSPLPRLGCPVSTPSPASTSGTGNA